MRPACALLFLLGVPIGASAAPDTLQTIEPASAGAAAPQPDAAAALPAARKLVDLAEQQYGPQAQQLVNPLLNLATTQRRMRDYYAAERNYRRAAGILEAHTGTGSHDLIAALTGLSAIYSENGDYAASVQLLQRAIDLSRKLDGLLNPQQLDMVDELVAGYLALGDYASVEREQQIALRIAVSSYATDIPRLVAALERNAGWFESMGRYSTARAVHTRTLLIASNVSQEKNLLMVEPLRGIARVHRLEFINGLENPVGDAYGSSSHSRPSREGETALKLVLEIVAAHPESGAADHARALMDLGDWRMFAGYPDQALETYREAWEALCGPGAGGTAAFNVPVQVFYRPLGSARPPATDAEGFVEHFVEVEFTVAADGRVRDLTLVASDLPEKSSRRIVRVIKEARYRPRFVGGAAVATPGVKFRETIYLRKS